MPDSFLRLPEVIKRCGFSRSRIYALAAKGDFPKPRKIGERAAAWLESEINQWVAQRAGGAK